MDQALFLDMCPVKMCFTFCKVLREFLSSRDKRPVRSLSGMDIFYVLLGRSYSCNRLLTLAVTRSVLPAFTIHFLLE